jgi:hypothetical protein
MKKNYFVLVCFLMVALPFTIKAQNMVVNGDLEQWNDANTPANWDLFENISQESTTVHGDSYSAAQMSESSSQWFRQDIQNIVGGQQYTISYYFFDNVDDAKTRIWSYWMDAGGTYLSNEDDDMLRPSEYSENNADWQHYNVVLTAPSNAAQFRFEVRAYNQDGNVGGYVYYDDFSMEGSSTNYPEPTNYPTDFDAMANGFGINVSWTDATGEQLPGSYLLLGQKGSSGEFTVPVDGTPVANDLDWSDGKVSVNVGFGLETYSFNGLDAAQEYEFTIYPYTNAGANINFKTDGTSPQDNATTSKIVIINEEDFEDGTLGTWWEYDVVGPQSWENYEYQGDQFARMSGYDDGAIENEDWLISPQMSLNVYIDVKFKFESARDFAGDDLKLYLSQDYDGSSDPNDFTWVELTDEANWSQDNWEWIESGIIDLSLFVNPSCYLAYKYTSSSSEAAGWEIDNILVYSDEGTGLFENSVYNLHLYPNPATTYIHLDATEKGYLTVVSITGQQLIRQDILKGPNSIDIQSLPEGLYVVHIVGGDGKNYSGKLMVK